MVKSHKVQGKILTISFVIVLALALAVGLSAQSYMKKGDSAPKFSAPGTDGKTHTLSSILKEGKTVFYFIKEGCPVNHRAAPFMSNIQKAYGEDANIVGIYNGSVNDAKKWATRYKADYLILSDPTQKIISDFKAPYSPWMVVVDTDAKVANVFEGASPKDLPRVNEIAAKNANKKLVQMSFEGAPSGGG